MKPFILVFFSLIFFSISHTISQTIGYVNSGKILSDMPEVIQIKGTIDSMQIADRDRIELMSTELTSEFIHLQEKDKNGELSPKQVQVESEKLQEKRQNILTFEQESQQRLMILQDSLLSPIRLQFENVLKIVAQENDLHYIMEDAPGLFWYKDQTMDVSSQIRAKLGVR